MRATKATIDRSSRSIAGAREGRGRPCAASKNFWPAHHAAKGHADLGQARRGPWRRRSGTSTSALALASWFCGHGRRGHRRYGGTSRQMNEADGAPPSGIVSVRNDARAARLLDESSAAGRARPTLQEVRAPGPRPRGQRSVPIVSPEASEASRRLRSERKQSAVACRGRSRRPTVRSGRGQARR